MEKFEKVNDRVSLLKTPFCSSWSGVVLVRNGNENILIDSGAEAGTVDSVLLPALAADGLTPEDISCLLCTHTHGDHVGGHYRLKQLCPELRCGVLDAGADKLRNPLKYNKLIRAPFPQYSPPPAAELNGVEPDFTFSDGEIIHGLKVICTPGHDSDCVCFLDTESATLVTGDSIQGNGTELQGCGLCMDLTGYRRALKRLSDENIMTVVTGHAYLPWGDAVLKGGKAQKMLCEALEIIESYGIIIRQAVDKGISDPAEEAQYLIKAVGGVMPPFLFMALFTVREFRREMGLDVE